MSYCYTGYTVGNHNGGSITLHFINSEGVTAYAMANVNTFHIRDCKHGKKGSPLPKGQFVPPETGTLMKIWLSASLPFPKSLTRLYKCIGKLKSFDFEFECQPDKKGMNKVINKTIKCIGKKEISKTLIGHSEGIVRTLQGHSEDIRNSSNAIVDAPSSDIQPRLKNNVIKVKDNKSKYKSLSNVINIDDNNLDKDSTEYTQTETLRIQSQSQDEWLEEYKKRDDELKQLSLEALDRKFANRKN